MPNPTSEDVHAGTPANDTGWGAGTCAAPMQSLIEICNKLKSFDIVRPVKGLFKDSLPQYANVIGEIALLHMDGDWYVSTHDILEYLYEQVSPRGIIQVDDYGHWDGCKKALHEFETKQNVKFKLHRIDATGVWFSKASLTPTANKSMLLNLGCGQRIHPDWVNVDFSQSCSGIISHDLTSGLPFCSESFEAVYHSHLLERFTKNHAPVFLKDCFRVLKPGGIIRVVVPDLETITRIYLLLLEKSVKGDPEARRRYDWIMLELFDHIVRTKAGGEMLNSGLDENFVIENMGFQVKSSMPIIRSSPHFRNQTSSQSENTLDPCKIGQFCLSAEINQWMYDRYSLHKLLQEAGFEEIKICRADESRIPDFNSYLLDIDANSSTRMPNSLFMEARK
jgi:predicted SAM-dependent methyltransferase